MNNKYKQNFLRAGALAKEVRSYGKELIVKGASYWDIYDKINRKIAALNARPAFPPQLALDSFAAHFLPQPDEDITLSNQLVKLDIGVCFEGAIGDCAVTVDLSGNHQPLIDAAEAALLNAEKSLHVNQPVSEIGKVIEETIHTFGFKPIKNLSGHGLGEYQIHMAPHIPNYHDQSKAIVKKGMTFAIEPFATNGMGFIYEGGEATIFMIGAAKPLRSDKARALLTKIRTFKGLPFSTRDLIDDSWPLLEVHNALLELLTAGVVKGYAPLIEKGNGMVAQAENSVLIDENGKIFITTR